MKRAFVLFVVAMLYCNFSLAQEPEPETDPNLLWKTEDYYTRFLVHPNGNILAGKYSTEVELDGKTGEVIREFPYQLIIYDISPDGKYISALTDQRCVIDYETQEVVVRFTNENTYPKFMPDSKTLVYFVIEKIGALSGNLRLRSYNIDTKRYLTSEQKISNTTTGAISISPDGRFVATEGWYYKYDDEGVTHLLLWDAQTLEPIRVLGEFEYFNSINSIKFSPDSRLVGFVVSGHGLYMYNTDNFSLYKFYGSTYGVGFISNDFIAIGTYWNQLITFEIINLNDGKSIYKRNDFTGMPEYNIFNNTLIVNYAYLYCYDFEKILSGASVEPETPNPFTVECTNNTLSIRNYTFGANSINCTISDINGRVLSNINLNTSTNEIRIPIKLLNGTYFLHIKDGGKEYVAKFCVVN
ncbi:MAG: hypothetical protein CVV22_04415 [Ignavibacteriae bacterium HGW-Ignavibacteriae-1]|jgi:WD40 repeat protein|nr:MAG: hypothetical protein CVV22_04415 [Ignavibacteriae bacterium HGW-Ignavibacteriae-1]